MFLDELSVWEVVVETLDDVVPVRPSVGARFVFIVAMGFGKASKVEPVLSPFLSEGWGVEKAVDELVDVWVIFKFLDLLRGGGSPVRS